MNVLLTWARISSVKIAILAFLLCAVMLYVAQVIMQFCFEINKLFVCLPGISHGMQLVPYWDLVLILPCATTELNVNTRWAWTDSKLVRFEFCVFKAYTVVLCVKSPVRSRVLVKSRAGQQLVSSDSLQESCAGVVMPAVKSSHVYCGAVCCTCCFENGICVCVFSSCVNEVLCYYYRFCAANENIC